jgi:MFS transporter, FLVCR family, disrupted in renal carcinoma protein 2
MLEDELLLPFADEKQVTYTVLGRRWYILFVASVVAFEQGFIWNNFGPIALTLKNETVFNWDDATIAWMGNWGPIAYVIAFMPTAWMLDTWFVRHTALMAAFLVLVGTGVRLISTGPSSTCLYLMHIGQCLNGLAGPFAMSAGTVLSAAWFAPNERTTSTATFCIANMAGVSASYLIGPLLVPQNGTIQDVRRYLWVCFALACAAMLLVLVYLPSKPPIGFEPSRTSSSSRMNIVDGVKALTQQRNFWYICLSYGAMTGLYAGWGPLYALIIESLGTQVAPHPQRTAAWIGFWSNLSGNTAGMIFSIMADRGVGRNHFKTILIVLSSCGVLVYVVFALLFLHKDWLQSAGLPAVYTLCILAGIFVNSTVPIFYELAVDSVYPVAEGLTTSVLTVTNNIGGLIFLLLPSIGVKIGDWVNYTVGGACLLSVVCMSLFQGRLRRTDEEND